MPLLANLTFRKGQFLVSVGSPALTALKRNSQNDTLKSMLRRCNVRKMQGQCICTIHVAFSMKESTALNEYDEDLTVNSRTAGAHRKRRHECISGFFYLLEPWLRGALLVRSNRFKTSTDLHPGLVKFPMLSMWPLKPYGAAVPSCRIQYSSRFRRKRVLRLGLFVGWYFFS